MNNFCPTTFIKTLIKTCNSIIAIGNLTFIELGENPENPENPENRDVISPKLLRLLFFSYFSIGYYFCIIIHLQSDINSLSWTKNPVERKFFDAFFCNFCPKIHNGGSKMGYFFYIFYNFCKRSLLFFNYFLHNLKILKISK